MLLTLMLASKIAAMTLMPGWAPMLRQLFDDGRIGQAQVDDGTAVVLARPAR